MLLSHKKKFLFIHIQKTGGTSITNHLRSNIADLQSYIKPHSPLSLAEEKYYEYYTAAFVRNPFERLVSWYVMIQSLKNPNYLQSEVLKRAKNFNEFILNCEDVVSKSGWKAFSQNQVDYLCDKNGKINIDFIGRFENLSEDAATLSKILNVTDRNIPHLNKSKHQHYREYYNTITKNIVKKRFERDLDFFKYSF